MTSQPRTHSAAIGLTFEEWNGWRAAAKEAGYEHLSDWVRDVVAAAIESGGATGDASRDLTRELVNISASLGALTDALEAEGTAQEKDARWQAVDRAADQLANLARVIMERGAL